jgi:hypothetical protein
MIIFPACENYLQSDQGKRFFGPEVVFGESRATKAIGLAFS